MQKPRYLKELIPKEQGEGDVEVLKEAIFKNRQKAVGVVRGTDAALYCDQEKSGVFPVFQLYDLIRLFWISMLSVFPHRVVLLV